MKNREKGGYGCGRKFSHFNILVHTYIKCLYVIMLLIDFLTRSAWELKKKRNQKRGGMRNRK